MIAGSRGIHQVAPEHLGTSWRLVLNYSCWFHGMSVFCLSIFLPPCFRAWTRGSNTYPDCVDKGLSLRETLASYGSVYYWNYSSHCADSSQDM